jgi:hypothetical protein
MQQPLGTTVVVLCSYFVHNVMCPANHMLTAALAAAWSVLQTPFSLAKALVVAGDKNVDEQFTFTVTATVVQPVTNLVLADNLPNGLMIDPAGTTITWLRVAGSGAAGTAILPSLAFAWLDA